jgi:hypothetical protein
LCARIKVLDHRSTVANFIAEYHGKASVAVRCFLELFADVSARLPSMPHVQTDVSQRCREWDEHRFGFIDSRGQHEYIGSWKERLVTADQATIGEQ